MGESVSTVMQLTPRYGAETQLATIYAMHVAFIIRWTDTTDHWSSQINVDWQQLRRQESRAQTARLTRRLCGDAMEMVCLYAMRVDCTKNYTR